MSAVEMARAAKQARLERMAPPPPVLEQPEEEFEPEPEPMPESDDEHDDNHVELDDRDKAARVYDEVVELDDTEPSPAGGVVCPWTLVDLPATPSLSDVQERQQQQEEESEQQRRQRHALQSQQQLQEQEQEQEQQQQQERGDANDAPVLPRWTGEGSLPVPQPRADDAAAKQQQLDTALAKSLQKQLELDHDEEVRLKELAASRHLAANPRVAVAVSQHSPYLRQQLTVTAQSDVRRYRNFDYDEAFEVDDDEDEAYDDRPWMTSNRVCEAH